MEEQNILAETAPLVDTGLISERGYYCYYDIIPEGDERFWNMPRHYNNVHVCNITFTAQKYVFILL